MKKIIAIILAMACAAVLFAGCGAKTDGSVSTDGSTSMEKVIGALYNMPWFFQR